MEIVLDTKDWTWVLHRPCPECGLDTRQVQRIETFARYFIHDPIHHLYDATGHRYNTKALPS